MNSRFFPKLNYTTVGKYGHFSKKKKNKFPEKLGVDFFKFIFY